MTKIVQCPSCNTKFALNESQLAGIETPKFQCSRCQTIFNLELDNPKDAEESPAEKNTTEKTTEEEQALKDEWDLGSENSPSKAEELEDPTDSYLKDFSIDLEKFSISPNPTSQDSTRFSQAPSPNETQLDFSFNQTNITRGAKDHDLATSQSEDIDLNAQESTSQSISPIEKKIGESSLKDSQTAISSRIDSKTLDNVIYGESGDQDNDISLNWDTDETKNEPTNSSEGLEDFSKIFRGGSQRSSTGSHAHIPIQESNIPNQEVETVKSPPPLRPSWDVLKEKIEKNEEDASSDSSYALIPTQNSSIDDANIKDNNSQSLSDNFAFKDPADSSDLNRSMKHTTVMQRDALDVEGFLKPVDDEIDQNFAVTSSKFNFKLPDIKSYFNKTKLATGVASEQILSNANGIHPFTKSLLKAWSVPLLFLFALFGWGQSLNGDGKLNSLESFINDSVALFTPPELFLPPMTLVIKHLKAELRPDSSGEPMVIVSGTIFNTGLEKILNPTLEARTFDEKHALVHTLRVPIPNQLEKYSSPVSLTEVTKEEILSLQEERIPNAIEPSTSALFKAVISDLGSGYKAFSAKIYSVGQIG